MEVGKLDRRILVQQPTDSQDDFGGTVTTWATYVSRWAAIRYTKGNEGYQVERKNALYTLLFTDRSDTGTRGITEKMRIIYEGKLYDIRQITERTDEFRIMYITIEAEQKGPEDSTIASGIGDEPGAGDVWGWAE